MGKTGRGYITGGGWRIEGKIHNRLEDRGARGCQGFKCIISLKGRERRGETEEQFYDLLKDEEQRWETGTYNV